MGGMDKRLITTGREGIDAGLRRVQPLLHDGVYIPMLDHFVQPFENSDQQLVAVGNRAAGASHRGRDAGYLVRKLGLVQIDPDADAKKPGPKIAQNAGDLSLVDEDVVGPLDLRFQRAQLFERT